MKNQQRFSIAGGIAQVRDSFKTRDVFLHDGRDLRRFRVGAKTQAGLVGVAGVALCFSVYGVAHAALGAVEMTGALGAPVSAEAKVAQLQGKLKSMQNDVAAIKRAAAAHAARVEQRQALITAALTGKRHPNLALDAPSIDQQSAALAADVVAPLRRVEQRQIKLAIEARKVIEQRYALTASQLRRLGLQPERVALRPVAMGGPYEPVNSSEATADTEADAQFRSLFMTWKKLDSLERGVIAIPSAQPVQSVTFTSFYGIRSDPFRGSAAMHAGVDIPGAMGSPIYATADGVIARAERSGGYGNMVEINHGRGIATRYGHLSKILVEPNTRVTRGQIIALMGSTGRSTGTHLHYEVRIDGHAVNPMPFLQNAGLIVAAQDRGQKVQHMGGPLTTNR